MREAQCNLIEPAFSCGGRAEATEGAEHRKWRKRRQRSTLPSSAAHLNRIESRTAPMERQALIASMVVLMVALIVIAGAPDEE